MESTVIATASRGSACFRRNSTSARAAEGSRTTSATVNWRWLERGLLRFSVPSQNRSWRHRGLRGSAHPIRLSAGNIGEMHSSLALAPPNFGLEIRYTRRATIDLGTPSQTFPPRRTLYIHCRTVEARPVNTGTKGTSGFGCADAVERPIRRSTRKLAIISSVESQLGSNERDADSS
jgi:hypothetical protein